MQNPSHLDRGDDFSIGAEHALPDPGEIPQVKDVVELCRSWKHLDLSQLPETTREGNQTRYSALDLLAKTTSCAKVALTNHACVIKSMFRKVLFVFFSRSKGYSVFCEITVWGIY